MVMRSAYVAVIAAVCTHTFATASETCGPKRKLDAKPEDVGVSSERLARYTQWIDEKVHDVN